MWQEQYFKLAVIESYVAIVMLAMMFIVLISFILIRAIVRYLRTHEKIKRSKESCKTCRHRAYCEESLLVRVCPKFEKKE